jgi:opacity protein-like surface antigen
MKRILIVLACAVMPETVFGGEVQPYLRVSGGPMLTGDAEVSGNAYSAGAEIDFDVGLVASQAAGTGREGFPMRIELEYDFVKHYAKEANFAGFTDGDKLIWHAYMANLYYDILGTSRFTPFLTAGCGVVDTENGPGSVFAYQLGAGFEYALFERFSLILSYRFFHLDDLEVDHPLGDYETGFKDHQFLAGGRYRF